VSQNRQEVKDRLRAEHDYQINLKAELEIRHLNWKMDQLINHQWHRLLEIQQIQTELIAELARVRIDAGKVLPSEEGQKAAPYGELASHIVNTRRPRTPSDGCLRLETWDKQLWPDKRSLRCCGLDFFPRLFTRISRLALPRSR